MSAVGSGRHTEDTPTKTCSLQLCHGLEAPSMFPTVEHRAAASRSWQGKHMSWTSMILQKARLGAWSSFCFQGTHWSAPGQRQLCQLCPKLLSHLALSAGATVQGYKTKVISLTFLVHQKVYACSSLVPEEQQAWHERGRCLQLQLG